MKKKTVLKAVLLSAFSLALLGALVACGSSNEGEEGSASSSSFQIAVPSDTTNEARALLLLEQQGLIKLKEGVGLEATANDIVENPYNITLIETEAASLPRTLQDVDLAVINGNYALSGGLDLSSALAGEDASSEAALEYANIIAVRGEETGSEKTKVLVEALQSDEVQAYIESTYNGVVVPVDVPAVLVSEDVASDDKIIKVGASPAPHSEILEFARPLIEEAGYTLEIIEYSDYIQPNVALADGELDANYFQHFPYLEDYNDNNGTTLASVAKIHFEPLALYPGKVASLEDILQ